MPVVVGLENESAVDRHLRLTVTRFPTGLRDGKAEESSTREGETNATIRERWA